jgi:nucleotide-binding universal stress UspA family protein
MTRRRTVEQSLTIQTDEYNGTREHLVRGNGLVRVPTLRWAAVLNALQGVLGQPTKFFGRDFLITFEFENGAIAVFCTQGRRRGEVVMSIDSRNPHAHVMGQVEQAIDELRAQLRQQAIDAGVPEDEYEVDGGGWDDIDY